MGEVRSKSAGFPVPTRAVLSFLALTFLITWGVIGIYVLAPEKASAWFGEISGSHPLFFVATWAPAISGPCHGNSR